MASDIYIIIIHKSQLCHSLTLLLPPLLPQPLCLGTCSEDQVSFKLLSSYRVLVLKVCTIIPGLLYLLNSQHYLAKYGVTQNDCWQRETVKQLQCDNEMCQFAENSFLFLLSTISKL